MNVQIIKQVKGERVYESFLKRWLDELFFELKKQKIRNKIFLQSHEMSLVFTSSYRIKSFNKKYRKKNKVTDILSFDGDKRVSLGELVVCLDVVKKKSKELHLPIKLYLCFLITHGVLHLLGYDHEQNAEKELEMFTLQNKVFKKVAAKLAPRYKERFDVEI